MGGNSREITTRLHARVTKRALRELKLLYPEEKAELRLKWSGYFRALGQEGISMWHRVHSAVDQDMRDRHPEEYHALRAKLRPGIEKEIGWTSLRPTLGQEPIEVTRRKGTMANRVRDIEKYSQFLTPELAQRLIAIAERVQRERA